MEILEIERKRMKEEPREVEAKVYNLFVKEKNGIVIVQDGLIKYVNSHVASLVGYFPEKLIGKPFASYLHHEEISKVTKLYLERLAGKETPIIYETKVYHKNGNIIHIEIRASEIKYQGRPADFVFIKKIR